MQTFSYLGANLLHCFETSLADKQLCNISRYLSFSCIKHRRNCLFEKLSSFCRDKHSNYRTLRGGKWLEKSRFKFPNFPTRVGNTNWIETKEFAVNEAWREPRTKTKCICNNTIGAFQLRLKTPAKWKLKYVFLLRNHASSATLLLYKIVWKDHLCLGVQGEVLVLFKIKIKNHHAINSHFLIIFVEFQAFLHNTRKIYNQSFFIVFAAWKLIRGRLN